MPIYIQYTLNHKYLKELRLLNLQNKNSKVASNMFIEIILKLDFTFSELYDSNIIQLYHFTDNRSH